MSFSEEVVENLAKNLCGYKSDDQLTNLYKWPINKALSRLSGAVKSAEWAKGVERSEDSVFYKTLDLRRHMRCALNDSNLTESDVNNYQTWIVNVWGKIRGGDKKEINNAIGKSLHSIIEQAEASHLKKNNKSFKFDRIASWSKYLAFKYPDERAIYDARVIYSLNWLLYQAGASRYFPDPGTRNTLMQAFDYCFLLFIKIIGVEGALKEVNSDINKRNEVPGKKSRAVDNIGKNVYFIKNQAYSEYCNLLGMLASRLYTNDPHALTKVEMILFAIADRDIVLSVIETLAGCKTGTPKPL